MSAARIAQARSCTRLIAQLNSVSVSLLLTDVRSSEYQFTDVFTSEAMQMLGGNGYINDYPAGRIMRDAQLYRVGA